MVAVRIYARAMPASVWKRHFSVACFSVSGSKVWALWHSQYIRQLKI